MTYQQALDSLFNYYDAYYFGNKYDEESVTHKQEFDLLLTLEGEHVVRALSWIRHNYDYYYKNSFTEKDDTPFSYLQGLITELDKGEKE